MKAKRFLKNMKEEGLELNSTNEKEYKDYWRTVADQNDGCANLIFEVGLHYITKEHFKDNSCIKALDSVIDYLKDQHKGYTDCCGEYDDVCVEPCRLAISELEMVREKLTNKK